MEKILYYPVTPLHINQGFGQNLNPFYAQQGLKGHNGLDFMTIHGQKIYASHNGVCYPQVDDHGGNGIVLKANGFQTIYWHLINDNAIVHTEQEVKVGDLLGYADSTGVSTGDHLHFGLKLNVNDQNNGFNGYIDPTPYFNGLYAEHINNPIPKFQFTKLLKLGSWNQEVRELQMLLVSKSLYKGAIDGIYRSVTFSAVKALQSQHSLKSDGIVGPRTRELLNSLL